MRHLAAENAKNIINIQIVLSSGGQRRRRQWKVAQIRAAGNEDAKRSLRLASYMGTTVQWGPSFEKDGGFAGGVGFVPGRGFLSFQSQPVNWQAWGIMTGGVTLKDIESNKKVTYQMATKALLPIRLLRDSALMPSPRCGESCESVGDEGTTTNTVTLSLLRIELASIGGG
jgi:hypothetical protein